MIARLKRFLHRVKNMSFERMNLYINQIHAESGTPRIITLIDMCWCALKYGIGYLEYRAYRFELIRDARIRRTYMTMGRNLAIISSYNDDEVAENLFEDKAGFLQRFDSYCKRRWLDLRKCSEEDFIAFVRSSKYIFAKPIDDCGGNGISRIDCSACDNPHALYAELTSKNIMLLEDAIEQHPHMMTLNSTSINTLRMVTIVDKQGESHLVYTLMRTGRAGSVVDNVHEGGLYIRVHDDGTPYEVAFCDRDGLTHETHPDSGVKFADFKIPMYDEAVSMCLKAALEVPEVRYVGWDVAISKDGPCLVEGNPRPGFDMIQNYYFMRDMDHGIYEEIKKFL